MSNGDDLPEEVKTRAEEIKDGSPDMDKSTAIAIARDQLNLAAEHEGISLEEDPCEDGWVMVGTKQKDGRTVPNCVPEEDADPANLETVDPDGGLLSHSANYLTLKDLDTEPIERTQEAENTVRYSSIRLLSPGIWADAGSQTETYYPPDGIAALKADYDDTEHDGPPLNIMHDLDTDEWKAHEASVAGYIDPDSLDTDDDGNLYGDLVLNTAKGAGQFADDNLKSTLENEGTVGFGGPSVEIPARGLKQSHDPQRDMPRVDGGLLTGVALVMDPASKSVNFAREAARRPIAMSGTNAKALTRQGAHMAPKILEADPGEVREILDMFGLDTDDLDDEEVMDMAEDLHGDLMDELEGGEEGAEMEDDDDEEDEEEMEMEGEDGMNDDMDAMEDRVQNLASRLEDLEDMVANAMTAEDVDAELSDAKGSELAAADTVDDLDRRLEQLEERGEEARTLTDVDGDDGFEPHYDTTPATSDGW